MERSAHSIKENMEMLEFAGPVFQVKADPLRYHLAIEVRFPESREVEYYLVDLEGKQPGLSSGRQGWWSSLRSVRGEYLILDHFEDPSLPVHKGIEIRKMPGFDLVFRDLEATVLGESELGVLVALREGEAVLVNNSGEQQPITGSGLVEEGLKEEYTAYRDQLFSWVKAPYFAWPDQLASSSPIMENPPFRPGASVLSWGDHLVAAWHSQLPNENYLLLLTYIYKGVAQWTRTLHPSLGKLNPEPFFMVGNYIIWTADRNQLCWCQL